MRVFGHSDRPKNHLKYCFETSNKHPVFFEYGVFCFACSVLHCAEQLVQEEVFLIFPNFLLGAKKACRT